jgi:hypothetical protein
MHEHGIAQGAVAHGHRQTANPVVHDFVLVHDAIRIGPHIAVDLGGDHEFVGAEPRGRRCIECRPIDAWDPVRGRSAVAKQLEVDAGVVLGIDALLPDIAELFATGR